MKFIFIKVVNDLGNVLTLLNKDSARRLNYRLLRVVIYGRFKRV